MNELPSPSTDDSVPSAPSFSPPSPPLPSYTSAPRIRAPGYVGLLNQGATCYLASLLQSLFFTPEFRRALLFHWRYQPSVHPAPAVCIPYQLQLLFARLLASSRPAVETAALTKSFRWTDAESFRQHDIQELMRVLFAALEKTLGKGRKGGEVTELTRTNSSSSASTPSSPAGSPDSSPSPSSPMSPASLATSFPSFSPTSPSFVHQLYCGQLVDYITCLKCQNRRQRLDEFMDISLDVADCSSLEEALLKFVQSETLTDGNRWRCDRCAEKVDAKKGLTFHKLPPILTIQLKRFVFDLNLMQRSKLQHRVTFPEMLDMQTFIQSDGQSLADSTATSPSSSTPSPLLYDLFAVLMHSGTANGGHYFSYIKSDAGPFLEFNDTNVWQCPPNVLESAYGGGKGGAVAYMLIYRSRELELAGVKGTEGAEMLLSLEELEKQSAADVNSLMRERGVRGAEDLEEEVKRRRQQEIALLPPSVKAIVDAEDAAYERQFAEQERERRRMEVTVIYANSEHVFHFDQEQRMSECLLTASSHFGIAADCPVDHLRFRRYDRANEWSAEPYPLESTLSSCHFGKRNTVRLEKRELGEDWPTFNPNVIPLRVIHVHADNLQSIVENASYPTDKGVATLSVDCTLPLSSLSSLIQPVFSIPIHRQRLIRLHDDRSVILSDLTISLQSLHFSAGNVLYVEDIGTELDDICPSASRVSPLCQQLDMSKCQIKLLFNLPVLSSEEGQKAVEAHEAPNYEQAIHVSKHQTVRHLKSLISQVISVPVSAFRLSRNETSPHYKDQDATLASVGLCDFSSVHVSLGRQCEKDEFNLKVYLMQTSPTRSFLYLFDFPTTSTSTIVQLKSSLLSHLNTSFGDVRGAGNGLGIQYFRLREKRGNLSSRIFEDSRILAEVLTDEAEICIEKCETEDHARVRKEAMILRWVWWDGKALGMEREMLVKKMVMMGAVREEIRTIWKKEKGESGVCPPLFLAKGMARVRMRKADVEKVQWMSEEELPDNKLAKNLPLRLSAGDLLLVSTILPPSHHKPAPSPQIPDARQAPPLPPPPPPLDPTSALSLSPSAPLANKPAVSVITAARSRLKRSVGIKGLGDGVLVKGAKISSVREHALYIDIEDEIAAIERACAEADRAEKERKEREEREEKAGKEEEEEKEQKESVVYHSEK